MRGRVLDVGAGGGSVALQLREHGDDVVDIDNSPGAIEVCWRRGVRDARARVRGPSTNTGNIRHRRTTRQQLWALRHAPESEAVAPSPAPDDKRRRADHRGVARVERRGAADAPWHARYRKRNVERGRLPGQIRICIRFRDLVGPWTDYPMVSSDECARSCTGPAGT